MIHRVLSVVELDGLDEEEGEGDGDEYCVLGKEGGRGFSGRGERGKRGEERERGEGEEGRVMREGEAARGESEMEERSGGRGGEGGKRDASDEQRQVEMMQSLLETVLNAAMRATCTASVLEYRFPRDQFLLDRTKTGRGVSLREREEEREWERRKTHAMSESSSFLLTLGKRGVRMERRSLYHTPLPIYGIEK